MSDCIAIAAEFPFRQQIVDTLKHAYRSLPTAEQDTGPQVMAGFDAQLKPAEGETESPAEAKRAVVKRVAEVYVETKGALEAPKEAEAESSHILLQHLLASTFDVSSDEYSSLVSSVIDAVRTGGEAAVAASRVTKAETAARILSNTYNFLPASSALRPKALVALLGLLAASDDLSTLPLTATQLAPAAAAWAISDAARVEYLTAAADIFARAGDLRTAAAIISLALSYSADAAVVNRALAVSLATPDRLDVDDVLKVQGVRDQVEGEMKELVDLFSTVDEIEAVSVGSRWVGAHQAFLESFGLPTLNGEEIQRKLRLVALGTLCARSSTKQLGYAEVASALQIDESDVEAWVIDAISANLIQARLSQPLAQVRINSVSSRASRRFGADEWALLERRLQEWKGAVAEARHVVDEAEAVAAQGFGGQQQQRKTRRDDEVVAA